jgi:hypothetical protein
VQPAEDEGLDEGGAGELAGAADESSGLGGVGGLGGEDGLQGVGQLG